MGFRHLKLLEFLFLRKKRYSYKVLPGEISIVMHQGIVFCPQSSFKEENSSLGRHLL